MRTFNHLYQDKTDLQNFIQNNDIIDSKRILVRIHTSCNTKDEAAAIAREVRELLPSAAIVGFSTFSIIYNGRTIDSACLISVSVFKDTDISVSHFTFDDKVPSALAHNIYTTLVGHDTKVLLMLCSDMFGMGHHLVNEINKLTTQVRIIGGVAGLPPSSTEAPFVFTDAGIFEKSVLVASLSGKGLNMYSNVMIGQEPIGDVHTITKAKGNEILEVDNTSAVQWFKELLGQDDNNVQETGTFEDMESLIVNFPLILENHNGASRCVSYSRKDDKILSYNNSLDNNINFRIGYLSPRTSAAQCNKICNEISNSPIESVFAYSCFLKLEAMHNCAEWELTPFSKTDFSGAFTSGEFGNIDGCNEYFNGTCSILGLSEDTDSRIKIDLMSFSNMRKIEDDRKDLFNYVLKKQGEFMYRKNRELARQVIEQAKLVSDKLFIYKPTGLENMTKFIYDNEYGMYDKICLISIEKGQMLKGHFGQDTYDKILNANIGNMKKLFNNNMIHYYQYDQHAFMIAGKTEYSAETFLKNTENLFLEYGNFNIEELSLPCVNIFAVVLNEDNILEKAGKALSYAAQHSKRFWVYSQNTEIDDKIDTSVYWVNIINEAIHSNCVVPYFQPIHNNTTGKINKFESLMRLSGKNGVVFYPNQFLDIAKEYRLYHQLSYQMISKVFELFDNRSEMVSINLTAFDISSEEMKGMIYDHLRTLKHPENFIFEIVESEEFRDFNILMDFIKTVRQYGAKIAIDDFGAGYSNLIELAKIAPDFIKIDGEITRNFATDERYKCIMLTIRYLATRLNIEVIAEYVESGDIQQKIRDLGIDYTQGYYFAKPMPYEQIDSFCENFNNKS